MELGATQDFTASVSHANNTAVSWSVNGSPGGSATTGTISVGGQFTAPGILPSPATVQIRATSVADSSMSGTANITITSQFTLKLTGPAQVVAGDSAVISAALAPEPNSNPSPVLHWSLTGSGCADTSCGTLVSISAGTVNYTAPAVAPSPANVTITATPEADPSKAASLDISILAQVSVTVSPASAGVELGQSVSLQATVTGAQDTSVTWDVNGTPGGDATVGMVAAASASSGQAIYTAPSGLPPSNPVTVRARSNADPNQSAAAAITVLNSVSVAVSPANATLAVNHRQPFTAQVKGSTSQNVEWQVNGIAGGNTSLGQICAPVITPCQPITASNGGSVDYLAPATVPMPNPVTIAAISQANPAKIASASVTVLAHIVVDVSPPSANVVPEATQQFTANVVGTSVQSVTWNVTGTGCNGAGAPCGLINATGLYTAPVTPPAPNSLAVVATSAEDTSRTGLASVTIATQATILKLLPASLTAGAAGGIPLRILGANFAASNPGPGSTVVLGGTARTTNCPDSTECTTTLAAADLAAPGNLSVAVRNPDGSASNQVPLIVVPDVPGEDVITLSSSAPAATGKDIVVVEPSTAGASAPSANATLNVAALGLFFAATNSCTLGATPLVLKRPVSGSATLDICAFSVGGLDTSFAYTITGPSPNDLNIVAKQPLGLGIVQLTVAVPSTALPGPRTLLVENSSKDRAAATGALEVK